MSGLLAWLLTRPISALRSRAEALLDHAGVGIAVSRNSRYELVSRHFCEMFRCERKQALGQLTRSFYASQTSYQELSDLARPALTLHGAFDGEAELARRDGHRFWAHLHGCPLERALVIAEKLRAAVADYRLEWNGVSHSVGASLGLVRVDGRYSSIAEVLRDADAACYAAKRAGRNQMAVFERTAAASAPAVPGTQPGPESTETLASAAVAASGASEVSV